MSVHSLLKSRITSAGDMEVVLNAMGIDWKRVMCINKRGWGLLRTFEVVINGETILIWQEAEGEAFSFQSEGTNFSRQSSIEELASLTREKVEAKQEEERRQEDARRIEAERRKEQARQEAERAREAENARAKEEAALILAQMGQSAKTGLPLEANTNSGGAISEQTNRVLGLMLQRNARQKIREQETDLKDRFGLFLDREEVLEDGVVELTFRG